MANITKLALEAALKKELLMKPLDKITINDLPRTAASAAWLSIIISKIFTIW